MVISSLPPTMSKTPQNMSDTSNLLLLPTYRLVAMGNNWQPWALSYGSSMVISSPQPTMDKTPQNMSETSNSLLLPLTDWLLWTITGSHGNSVMGLLWS